MRCAAAPHPSINTLNQDPLVGIGLAARQRFLPTSKRNIPAHCTYPSRLPRGSIAHIPNPNTAQDVGRGSSRPGARHRPLSLQSSMLPTKYTRLLRMNQGYQRISSGRQQSFRSSPSSSKMRNATSKKQMRILKRRSCQR